jgi:OOP family OmpA-OmpF porin
MRHIHEYSPTPPVSPLVRRIAIALVLVALVCFPFLARAADPGLEEYHIAASGFYMQADNDRDVGNSNFGWQVNPGMRLKDNWWLEGHLFGAVLDRGSQQTTDFYQYGVGGDLQYAFGNRDQLTPYVLAGAGASYNDVVPNSEDGWDYFANVGVGITHNFFGMDLLRWRIEARAVYDHFAEHYIDYRIGAGLEFALHKHQAAAPAPEPQRVVHEVTREVVREVPVAVPAAVGDVDSDKDGVVNTKDKCPNTPPGAKVDGDGCVIAQTLTMRDITFETASSRLTMNGQHILDQVVSFLKADDSVQMSVEGHTDARGAAPYNLTLSQARASAVRKYLVDHGIDAKRLTAKGFGKTRPVASNDTEEGREANRRVEMVITKAKK